jgi:hypothetical protein
LAVRCHISVDTVAEVTHNVKIAFISSDGDSVAGNGEAIVKACLPKADSVQFTSIKLSSHTLRPVGQEAGDQFKCWGGRTSAADISCDNAERVGLTWNSLEGEGVGIEGSRCLSADSTTSISVGDGDSVADTLILGTVRPANSELITGSLSSDLLKLGWHRGNRAGNLGD